MNKVPKPKRTDWRFVDIEKNSESSSISVDRTFIRVLPKRRPYNYWSDFGRASAIFTCGFCGSYERCFVWSMAGSGKRCSGCNSLMTSGVTVAELDAGILEINLPESIRNQIV